MDGMASDGAYNTRAVMVQFQAVFRGKFLDARAVGRVYIRPIHRWLSRKQVKSPKKWPGKSSQICFLFELLRYKGQHDLEIDDFLKQFGYLWSRRILFASWSVLTRVHMNNYCTGQWNAKDENINDHASYWPIVGILKALVSFCTLSNFAALFCLVPQTSEQKQTSLRNSHLPAWI